MAPGPSPIALRALLAALPALLAGIGQAQCQPAAGATQLGIRGFATAYFQQFRTDTANGTVELYGGVCLVGASPAWTLAADKVQVSGLEGVLSVTASAPTLTIQGWSATAGTLTATRTTLHLAAAHLSGHGVSGTARDLELDLASGALALKGIDLHGAAFYLLGDTATLAGDGLAVTAPRVTTCHCAGPPLYRVTGATAQVAVQAQRIVLTGGHVDVGGVQVPLASEVTIDAESLKALSLPLKVEYVEGDSASGTPATGLGVLLTHLGLAPGVYARLGATGLDADHPLASVALLEGKADGASFTFGKAPGGMRFEEESDHDVTPWFDAGFDTRILEPGNRDTLREDVLHGRLHTAVPSLNGGASLTLLAAASSQTPDSGPVAGARLSAKATTTAATPAGAAWGRFRLRLTGQASEYPDQQAMQWGVDVAPGYAVRLGPVHLELGYLARFTNSGSPFTTSLDRLERTQRPSGTVSVAGTLAPGLRGSARVRAQYDLVGNQSVDAGLDQLDVSASLTQAVGAWEVTATGDAVLAGVLAPDGERDGYLQAGLDASRGDLALGARARYTYAPTPTGFDLLQVSAAVPIRAPGVTLRPYLALDFAPTLASGSLPAISGHGLDLSLPTCCGTLDLGYRDDDGTWTVKVAVDLQAHAAQASAAGGCPGGPPAPAGVGAAARTVVGTVDASDAEATAPTCPSTAPEAGIMGAAHGAAPP